MQEDLTISARLAPGAVDPAILNAMDSFDPAERKNALAEAAALVTAGRVAPPSLTGFANVHAHTFFSYSCEDYSPTRLVWESLLRGLDVVGSTDFDVLDAMDEMLAAGDSLAVRTTVSLETRTFVDTYADREINSPGEPGVMYTMGVGFVRLPEKGSPARSFLASLAEQSRERNVIMVGKVNTVLTETAVDYEQDVLPLTPSGNATERHICAAYDLKARQVFPETGALAAYWADKLGRTPDEMTKLLGDTGALRNAIRAKLMKKGGVGYSRPGSGAFPPVREFFQMVFAARAIPCLAWLDGGSAGEADPEALLDDAMDWGARIVNIIPERNWNFADAGVKAKKMAAMDAFVQAARARSLPILAGTEMNSPGQKFVDSFAAPELAPYVDDFLDAAYLLYGHTVLERSCGKGMMSDWAARSFAGDKTWANAFYAEIGRKAAPGRGVAEKAAALGQDADPAAIAAAF